MNNYGQTNVPADLRDVIAVAAGQYHSLALQAWHRPGLGWGKRDVPVGLSNVVAIAAGSSHQLGRGERGTGGRWGLNLNGQTNVPAALSNVIAVAAVPPTAWRCASAPWQSPSPTPLPSRPHP